MPRIVIVGSGFGALAAARTVRRAAPAAELIVVSPKPEFVYLPGLIWLPAGQCQSDELRVDLRPWFQRWRIAHVAAEATGLSADGRTLATSAGPVINDGLIIASGGRFIKKLPGIEHAIVPCEGIAAAEQFRDRLRALNGGTIAMGFASNPNEPAAMRGGPIFEFLLGLDRQLRVEGRRAAFRLIFFTPAPRPGNRLGPQAVDRLLAEMARCEIDTRYIGQKILGFEAGAVRTEGGTFAADLVLFMPGLTGNAWFDNTALPRSPGGLLQADEYCRVPGQERIYVVGDAGSFPGPEWMPKQAHMADLQAQAAARNLLGELRGQSPRHRFQVELLCILEAHDRGMLVARTERYNLMLPHSRLFHWLKHGFAWNYLRRYRRP